MSPLSLLFFFSFFTAINSQPTYPKGFLINCGAATSSVIDGRRYLPDAPFISAGTPKSLPNPGSLPILTTVRSFPLDGSRKFCYAVPTYRSGKYLVRTTYFYGGINGPDHPVPPVFYQIVDGTLWSTVNTTGDYGRGKATYYEGIFLAKGRSISVCVARNAATDSDMFISAVEVVLLGGSVYNSTDFDKHGLAVVARHSFGYEGPIMRFPDDPFDRFWEPFTYNNLTHTTSNSSTVLVSGFWNLPPSKVFATSLTTDQPKPMEFQWPPFSLPNSTYYIALYFAENRASASDGSRVLDITINGLPYYKNLNVTQSGVVVFATQWPLSGITELVLAPATGSSIAPLINAGELFNILVLGGRTISRDSIALERMKRNLKNVPLDWNGDPCFPQGYSWTGITCSDGPIGRVVALNFSNMGLSGSLSPSIANLTALSDILVEGNGLSGSIPELGTLRMLERLHLQGNHFSGEIPQSLGNISGLHELFLQNNNLTGQVPSSLAAKPGLNLQISPGNNFS